MKAGDSFVENLLIIVSNFKLSLSIFLEIANCFCVMIALCC